MKKQDIKWTKKNLTALRDCLTDIVFGDHGLDQLEEFTQEHFGEDDDTCLEEGVAYSDKVSEEIDRRFGLAFPELFTKEKVKK